MRANGKSIKVDVIVTLEERMHVARSRHAGLIDIVWRTY
jgi:hypothetical protein